MSRPEKEGYTQEHREHNAHREIAFTESQRDALLIAIRNEINSCENELRRLSDAGLHDRQATEDYNAIIELMSRLESVHNLLK